MLVITRQAGQSVKIGDDVEVRILEVKGKHVRVGIEAPQKLPVHRNEVYNRIVAGQEDRS